MEDPHHLRTVRGDVVERRRSVVAVVVGLAAISLIGILLTTGDRPTWQPAPDGTAAEPGEAVEPTVAALRDGPWTDPPTDATVVVMAGGGRYWTVDVGDGTVSPGSLDVDRRAFTPVEAVLDGHLLTHWDGRGRAVPLAGGDPVDLGPVAERASRPLLFPSERDGAVWVVAPAGDGADASLTVTERTVDGEVLRSAAGTFPRLDPPLAAAGGGLVARGPGGRVDLVDVGSGRRRLVAEPGTERTLVAIGPSTVVLAERACDAGCALVLVDVASGDERIVPPPEHAGVRSGDGSVSPDGRTVVHAVSTDLPNDVRPHYVVTDLEEGTSRLTDVAAGPGIAWSADSSTFFTSPNRVRGRQADGRIIAHRVDQGTTAPLPVLVRMPVSTAWTLAG